MSDTHGSHDHGSDHGSDHGAAHATRPAASGPLAYPGALAWALGIATGVGFIGLLYLNAGHHEGGHAEAAPAADGAPAAAPAH